MTVGSPPIRIAFLSTGLAVGGAETQLVRMATNLDRARWEPSVFSLLPPQSFLEELRNAGVPVTSLGARKGVPPLLPFAKLCRHLKLRLPQVLVCFMFHANLLGRIAGHLSGVPVIVSSVRTPHMGARWRETALRWTDRMGDITTTNSSATAQRLVEQGMVAPQRLRVIPNALAPNGGLHGAGGQALREALGIPNDDFLWVAIGRLEPPKDYPTLLSAFAGLSSARSHARLAIAGEGFLREQLEDTVRALGLGSRVSFLGFRADIPGLLRCADAFVQSSAWEGLPNTVLEALQAGKPVVVTSAGGTAELVRDGLDGLIVPPGDPDKLCSAMDWLMTMPAEERRLLGERGRRSVEEQYSLGRVMAAWESLWLELLEEKRHGLGGGPP